MAALLGKRNITQWVSSASAVLESEPCLDCRTSMRR
jgi:hypothetical protein